MMQPRSVSKSDILSHNVVVGTVEMSLADFLSLCIAHDIQQIPLGLTYVDLCAARDRFLEAGVSALEGHASSDKWVQLELDFDSDCVSHEVYRRVALIAQEMLQKGCIDAFFFMHKPPGMRVRFETNQIGRDELAGKLWDQFTTIKNEGLVKHIVPGVYEPETHLFGGVASMRSVHELFTIDSLAWLEYHALGISQAEAGAVWVLSLAMLRALFNGLRIADWEDLDIWDRLRRKTGRLLAADIIAESQFAEVAAAIRAYWLNPHSLLDALPDAVRIILTVYSEALGPVVERWYKGYFATRNAHVGPRAAAALCVMFHWNRAALSLTRQALIVEALAARDTV
jgi:thiopeptide-type bacteriocin biosynthesis protein